MKKEPKANNFHDHFNSKERREYNINLLDIEMIKQSRENIVTKENDSTTRGERGTKKDNHTTESGSSNQK